MAGLPLYVASSPEQVKELVDLVEPMLDDVLKTIHTEDVGVHVQGSTLGSLEALLSFLKKSKIPVATISIGPVHKKDVFKVHA